MPEEGKGDGDGAREGVVLQGDGGSAFGGTGGCEAGLGGNEVEDGEGDGGSIP